MTLPRPPFMLAALAAVVLMSSLLTAAPKESPADATPSSKAKKKPGKGDTFTCAGREFIRGRRSKPNRFPLAMRVILDRPTPCIDGGLK